MKEMTHIPPWHLGQVREGMPIGFQQAEQSCLSNAQYFLEVGSGDLAVVVALKQHLGLLV